MIAYTVLTPTDAVITVFCRSLHAALDMAEHDLKRDWAPATISLGRRHWDIEAIMGQLAMRSAAPAATLCSPGLSRSN